MSDQLPEFSEGDVLEARGNRYEVGGVARVRPTHADGPKVLHYSLEPEDEGDPLATLSPERGEDPTFVLTEYHDVGPDGVEAVDE